MSTYLPIRPGVPDWWIIVERDSGDLYLGPWANEADAAHALNNSPLVQSECETDATDCYYQHVAPNPDHGDEVALIDHDDPDHTGSDVEA